MKNKIETTNKKTNLKKDTKGLSTVEYIVLLALIVVAAVALWGEFGVQVEDRIKAGTEAIEGMK